MSNMTTDEATLTTISILSTPADSAKDTYPGFPMSIIVTGFFVTSLAYLVCFCCCLIQFFIRRGREMRQTGNPPPPSGQKNDTLKRRFLKQFRNSLRRLQRSSSRNTQELQMVRRMSSLAGSSSCPICFDDYSGDPAEILMGKIKSCGHFYHFECIWTWLETRGSCPLCRETVTLKEDDIQAIALRHLLGELEKNSQDHALVNMAASNSYVNNPSESAEQASDNVRPPTELSAGGAVNDGFEDIPLEDYSVNSNSDLDETVINMAEVAADSPPSESPSESPSRSPSVKSSPVNPSEIESRVQIA